MTIVRQQTRRGRFGVSGTGQVVRIGGPQNRSAAGSGSFKVSGTGSSSLVSPLGTPSWSTVPNISFTQGTAGTYDLTQHITNWSSSLYVVQLDATSSLPQLGIWIDLNGVLHYDGLAPVGVSNLTFTIAALAQGFTSRRATRGILRTVDFESTASLGTAYGDVMGRVPGTIGAVPALDTSQKASGTQSLKFDIPAHARDDMSGSWFCRLTDDNVQIGEFETLYVQWKQRFTASFLNFLFVNRLSQSGTVTVTNGSTQVTGVGTSFLSLSAALSRGFLVRDESTYFGVASIQSDTLLTLSSAYTGTSGSGLVWGTVGATGGGWKQVNIGGGDSAACTPSHALAPACISSCNQAEVVVQNTEQRMAPQMYNSCPGTGSASHGGGDGFKTLVGGFDHELQPGGSGGQCLESLSPKGGPPGPGCFGYFPDEWMTFQVEIRVGNYVGNEYQNSYVRLWVAREGQASQLVIDWGPYALSCGPNGGFPQLKYGKVWLTNYHTTIDGTMNNPTGAIWYDELIISRTRLADAA